jgi:hypothetical protein
LTGNLRDNLNQERADDDPIADRDLVNIAPLRWISIAHCAASNALPNSTRNASPNCFYFSAVKPWKDFPKQPAMFLQQFLGKLFVVLAQRAVADHVGEHDGDQLPLLIGARF